jgi:Ca2+-binding RTX toxin-like protein
MEELQIAGQPEATALRPDLETYPPEAIDDVLIRPFPLPRPNIITGTEQNDYLTTTARNDVVNALAGDDFITGSRGNDIINGDKGSDTMSYARLGGAISLGATGTVDKGAFGFDQLNGVEKIVASQLGGDVINAATATGSARINADLSVNKLSVQDIPGIPGGLNFVVENFENVNGTQNDDTITGDRKNNTIDGGAGNDVLAGTSSIGSFPGLNEVDVLTGGAGNDQFLLGRAAGLYYNGNGDADFAKITDFTDGADRFFLGGGSYRTNVDETALFAVNIGDQGQEVLDLVAKIAYAPVNGVLNPAKSAAVALSDAAVDPLTATKSFSLSAGQSFGNFTAATF